MGGVHGCVGCVGFGLWLWVGGFLGEKVGGMGGMEGAMVSCCDGAGGAWALLVDGVVVLTVWVEGELGWDLYQKLGMKLSSWLYTM